MKRAYAYILLAVIFCTLFSSCGGGPGKQLENSNIAAMDVSVYSSRGKFLAEEKIEDAGIAAGLYGSVFSGAASDAKQCSALPDGKKGAPYLKYKISFIDKSGARQDIGIYSECGFSLFDGEKETLYAYGENYSGDLCADADSSFMVWCSSLILAGNADLPEEMFEQKPGGVSLSSELFDRAYTVKILQVSGNDVWNINRLDDAFGMVRAGAGSIVISQFWKKGYAFLFDGQQAMYHIKFLDGKGAELLSVSCYGESPRIKGRYVYLVTGGGKDAVFIYPLDITRIPGL